MTAAERREAIASDKTGTGFIFNMFYSELCDMCYCITEDLEEIIIACGLSLEEVNASKALKKGLAKALKEYNADFYTKGD